MKTLDLTYHSLIPIPFDLNTREGFFLLSRLNPDDLEVFPSHAPVIASPHKAAAAISNLVKSPPIEVVAGSSTVVDVPPLEDADDSSVSVMDRIGPPAPKKKTRSKRSGISFPFFHYLTTSY